MTTRKGGWSGARGERKKFSVEDKAREEWLPVAVKRIVERFDPLQVILFGSLARGKAKPDSDVDLLVVFEHVDRKDKRVLVVEIRRALADAPIAKDVFVSDLDEIERRGKLVGTVLREALREGKVLYDRP